MQQLMENQESQISEQKKMVGSIIELIGKLRDDNSSEDQIDS